MKSILLLCFLFSSCSVMYKKLGGDFSHKPDEINQVLSQDAQKLIKESFTNIDLKKIEDLHMHVAGLGKGNTGLWVNPNMRKWWKHLGKYNRFNVYLSASGVQDIDKADQEYVTRLVSLHKNLPFVFKSHIFGFDYHYKKDGTIDYHHSEFYVPNDYIVELSKKNPEYFVPVVSVHPYKKGAIEELEKYAEMGVRHVKWLPNAMGMDPSDQSLERYYKTLIANNMTLITHTGEEKAVEGEAFQELANPLKLRYPLDLGVKIIMAHMSSRGQCKDYDHQNVKVECFDLFWRLFKEKKYEKNLFSEMSGLLIHARIGRPLNKLIEHPEVHHRIGYGSDYPLVAINFIYRTSQLYELGYLTEGEKEALNEIYGVNPLLFHYVMLRTVRHPKTKEKLTSEAFHSPFL
ncbi:amidohydrolase family protein [Halobacteriovorax sp. GB3]|uniref:amidohydrolase family protein n=1 Tax=Halobacteriovorax sp. GB3 TaxID=2719615 RepID=UPI002362A1A9|nr:amidohydrolase family protein [Halobacteriovorax sp. GB3]MDD0853158.1 amidohydrolase family protein [Halobacteriovorax sp. GB3]